MRSALVVLTALGLAMAQNTQLLDFSSGALPDCAHQCSPLEQAQAACIPPAAPVSSTDIYKSCFCQSNFLQSLRGSPNGLCDAACPADGLSQIRNWFLGQCQQEAAGPATTTSTSAPAASTGPAGSAASNSTTVVDGPNSWWDNHWRWVLMLIIIFLAIIAGSIGGVWLRRRRKRKIAVNPTPVAWGPHQHQHFTQGHTTYHPNPEKAAAPGAAMPRAAPSTRVPKGKEKATTG